MNKQFNINVKGWENGKSIPARFAFGQPGENEPFQVSGNLNPQINWTGVPAGTQSFVLSCHDKDVPSSGEDVNQEGKFVSASLPRVDFDHLILVDIPSHVSEIPEGALSNGVTAKGKPCEIVEFGRVGKNNYTEWFENDPEMAGVYGGYDGPCPPWNDSIIHHYYFTLYALSLKTVGLSGAFTRADALKVMEGNILAESCYVGTYSMNPNL